MPRKHHIVNICDPGAKDILIVYLICTPRKHDLVNISEPHAKVALFSKYMWFRRCEITIFYVLLSGTEDTPYFLTVVIYGTGARRKRRANKKVATVTILRLFINVFLDICRALSVRWDLGCCHGGMLAEPNVIFIFVWLNVFYAYQSSVYMIYVVCVVWCLVIQ